MLAAVFMTAALTACGSPAAESTKPASEEETVTEKTGVPEPVALPSWNEEYDLGTEYLSAGNYNDAISAFSEAISAAPEEISPYLARGSAYVLQSTADSSAADEALASAWNDYEAASKLDETNEEAYLGMADVLIRREEFDEAYDLLSSVKDTVSVNTKILEKIREIEEDGTYKDSSEQVRKKGIFDADGNLKEYYVYEYNAAGYKTGWKIYRDGELSQYCVVTFGDDGLPARNDYYYPDGTLISWQTMEYDENGLEIRRDVYTEKEGHVAYYLTYYDEEGKETGYDGYYADGTMFGYWRSEYDEEGHLLQETHYNPDGSIAEVLTPDEE